jgi:phosphatidylserine decarboxylase
MNLHRPDPDLEQARDTWAAMDHISVPAPPNPEVHERPASVLARLFLQEDLNFLVTNRLPRRAATRLVGRISSVRNRHFAAGAIAIWRLFADDLRLHESPEQHFESLHDCFIRPLRPGVRPIHREPGVVVSPCDGVLGAHGRVREATAFQAKGFPYRLRDLFPDPADAERFEDGTFATLRLKANMYHRFHAPVACRVRKVTYIAGDTWNVNPIALRRVERLFCRNARVAMDLELADGTRGITLVPVAAILVASIRLHCVDATMSEHLVGPCELPCDATYEAGDEMGYFHAGSTILCFADSRFSLAPGLTDGCVVRMGEPLLFNTKETHHGASDVS